MRKNILKSHKGYITLIAVLLTGSIALSLTLSSILLGVGVSRSVFADEEREKAKYLADACAEEALEMIVDDNAFVGSNNLSLSTGTCTYTVTNTGGDTRAIASSGSAGTIISRVEVTIDAIVPSVNVSSWQYVADF